MTTLSSRDRAGRRARLLTSLSLALFAMLAVIANARTGTSGPMLLTVMLAPMAVLPPVPRRLAVIDRDHGWPVAVTLAAAIPFALFGAWLVMRAMVAALGAS
jgi:hypothetical protein